MLSFKRGTGGLGDFGAFAETDSALEEIRESAVPGRDRVGTVKKEKE